MASFELDRRNVAGCAVAQICRRTRSRLSGCVSHFSHLALLTPDITQPIALGNHLRAITVKRLTHVVPLTGKLLV